MKKRTATVERATRETKISIGLNIDGSGACRARTGMPFLNHMLDLLAKHSLMDLRVRARGDLAVDYHHTVEDVGLALGQALDKALGERKGLTRYGWSLLPMDDALAQVALDLGGRPYLVYDVKTSRKRIGTFDLQLVEEFMRALSVQARMNLHISLVYGREAHHSIEAVFKGLAVALRAACAVDPRVKGLPSSKGKV